MQLIHSITLNLAAAAMCGLVLSLAIAAQSTDLNFPTAVTTNEIDGTVKARDIGDARLTSYFYTFDGGQGDVFINVVTNNFTGDIDVFAAEAFRPLTKMVIYADGGMNETGRLLYLRKGERLILRVEGRSPNDDPATFRIKFAGSFIALTPQKAEGTPSIKQPEVDAESGIRVNSVGTIVEVIPKPQPPAKEKTVAKEKSTDSRISEPEKKTKDTEPTAAANTELPTTPKIAAVKPKEKKSKPPTPPKTRPVAKKADEVASKGTPATKSPKKIDAPEPSTVFKRPPKVKTKAAIETTAGKTPKPPPTPEETRPDALASIRLVVLLKDGNAIERPMSEVQKFSVDKGILTVIAKDGSTVKYSLLDVAKVTIE